MKEKLDLVYNGLLIVGLLIPLINLALGGLGDVLNLDLDVDGDTGFDSPLPVNITCLFFGCAVVGLVGGRLNQVFPVLPAIILSLLCGAAGYALLYRFVIRPLKHNDASAMKMKDMRGAVGTVTVAIPYGGKGEAKFKDKLGSPISYMVRYNDTDFPTYDTIQVGSSVSVVGIEGDTLVVCMAPSEQTR